ncbi:MAG: SDR family NAD(P)-dependent oxidoreductase [Roseiarcus sp.]
MGDGRSLAGRHAVVTGGAKGIGAAVSETLARLGADVTIMGRDAEALRVHAERLRTTYGGRVADVVADVGDPSSIEAAFATATTALGAPAILVNNAGIATSAPFHRIDLDLWNRVLNVDLTGAFLCTRQVLKAMIEAKFGRVINIASTAGHTGYAYVTAYCAAKHGMVGMTRALAIETARTGVTVNAVCPGYTATDIVDKAVETITQKTGRSREEALGDLVAHNPQRRFVQPDEVADAVAWLCLPSSASITGQSILIAGGELM